MHLTRLLLSCCCILFVGSVPLWGADEENVELRKERETFEREVEFSTRPIRDRYLSRLEKLKRMLGSRGDARTALAVQQEMERVSPVGGSGVGKFAGSWTLLYSSGSISSKRHYTIASSGVVTWSDENGKPINVVGKIQAEGTDFTIRFPGDERVERVTLAPNKLLVLEHFAPKESYPKGAPVMYATGVRAQ